MPRILAMTILFGAVYLGGCASIPDELPPRKPIQDFYSIRGKWEGTATFHQQNNRTETLKVNFTGEGVYQWSWPSGGYIGTMRLEDGRILYKEPNGKSGSITLHEDKKKNRYLKFSNEDKSMTGVLAPADDSSLFF